MKGAPSMNELKNYRVNRERQHEGIKQTLYDFQTYNGAAGQSELTFFQQPIGQGGKTRADTNMEVAGSLPSPKKFLVQSIEILFFPGVNPVTQSAVGIAASNHANDVYALSKDGYLDFFIGSKSYLIEAPLGRFPSKTRLSLESAHAIDVKQVAAANATEQVSTDYGTLAGRPYFVEPAILLEPTQNFSISLKWNAAVVLPSGQNARIGIVLDGILYRLSQ